MAEDGTPALNLNAMLWAHELQAGRRGGEERSACCDREGGAVTWANGGEGKGKGGREGGERGSELSSYQQGTWED